MFKKNTLGKPAFFITLGIMHLGLVSPANPHLQTNRKLKHSNRKLKHSIYYNSLSIYLSHKQVFLYLFKNGVTKTSRNSLMHSKRKKKPKEKLIPSTHKRVLKVKQNKKNWFKLVILT